MTTLASLKELYLLGFIQDVEYIARLALLGICDPNINSEVIDDPVPVEPKPEESLIASAPEVIEEEIVFVPVVPPKPIIVPEAPKRILPRIVPKKPSRPKPRKLIAKPKRPLNKRKPLVRRWRSAGRIIATREQNVHLADSISEKDRRRDSYLKSVHHRNRKRNMELIRNFRAAKKWSATKHDRPRKIRKSRVDGTEEKLFQARISKKNVILYNERCTLFDRNVWAMKELRKYHLEVSQLSETEEA